MQLLKIRVGLLSPCHFYQPDARQPACGESFAPINSLVVVALTIVRSLHMLSVHLSLLHKKKKKKKKELNRLKSFYH